MKQGRVIALLASLSLAGLALASCDSQGDPAAAPSIEAVPTVAATMPATTADPSATAALRSFDGRDTDHDGFVSNVENAAAADKVFEAIDTDQDGALTDAEYTAARVALGLTMLPGSAELIGRLDQDGDGQLTLAEWIAGEGRAFREADRNGDGKLDRAEWDAMPRLTGAPPAAPATQAVSPAKP